MSSNINNMALFDGFLLGTEFKEYLDRQGVTDALSKVLESLLNEPEWPTNPQEYIRKYLATLCGASPDPLVELKEMREKLQELKKETLEQREKVAKKFALEAAARKAKEMPSCSSGNKKRNRKLFE